MPESEARKRADIARNLKTPNISLRMTKELIATIEAEAASRGMSRSQFLLTIINNWLKNPDF